METLLFKIIMCHLVGDYVLQCDFIAKSKGENWYHLFVHCALYILPFWIAFDFDIMRLIVLFATHIVTDAAKERYKAIDYPLD